MLSIRCNSGIKSRKNQGHPERITKNKPFIDGYNWKGIDYPSEKYGWKKNEKNYLSFIKRNNIYNSGCFYCLNCVHLFGTKNKLELHKRVCENKYFCNIVMSSEDTKTLEFNQHRKSDKTPIYGDL